VASDRREKWHPAGEFGSGRLALSAPGRLRHLQNLQLTRVPATTVLDYLAAGDSPDTFPDDFPSDIASKGLRRMIVGVRECFAGGPSLILGCTE
jgi:hypothetical protein